MRPRFNLKAGFLSILLAIFASNPFLQANAAGEIILVGISPYELAPSESKVLEEGKIIQIPQSHDWQREIDELYKPSKVILRQPSGFVGLYDSKGTLLRRMELNSPPNIPQYTEPPPPSSRAYYAKDMDNIGYQTGGTVDPFAEVDRFANKNQAKLAPGWGYGEPRQKRGIGGALLDFAAIAPLDPVTPFNYPGTYNSMGLAGAYSLGVLPHVGGLFVEMKRAHDDQKHYEATRLQVPTYHERPVQYHNPRDPSNPIVVDPAMQYGLNPPPQAIYMNNPDLPGKIDHNIKRMQYDPANGIQEQELEFE